ncbi:SPOR domain protein [Geotalea daltonii FRC-32]|uniref:SPOR domain protein n=1 Tax=Geotalea daltonii (strain DSM 22248 / JCM 15807 / FRC-32) TaxID=316067 RepID=B9M2S1_GEODF|nr:SPOR domain-containing protein [Geotalea daltonii]ACM21267.1 SPOR domain protein [Geotalea daltonii FRC-32]
MVLDYCERRPVSKNRPKKQPIGILVFIVAGAVIISFVGGFAGGWFFGGRAVKNTYEKTTAKPAVTPSLAPQAQPAGQDVPLTFYQTLPNGAKAVIGSGLNPAKAGEEQNKATPGPQNLQEQKLLSPGAPPKSEANTETAAVPKTPAKSQASGEGTYCVQIASLRDKTEAEAIRTNLLSKGQAAYILESNVQGKGTWYRVRMGKHLKQSEAGELAAKAGKGAIVIAE